MWRPAGKLYTKHQATNNKQQVTIQLVKKKGGSLQGLLIFNQ